VLITVEDGRATKIQGDPAHPVTRGFLCAKVAKYLDRVYSPERVLYPARRVGGKGPGPLWERISWDAALDEICQRFRGIGQQFGSEAILPYSYGGTLGVLHGGSMDRCFFHRLGASQLARNICSKTGEVSLISVLGRKLGTEPEQFAHSRYIIAWAPTSTATTSTCGHSSRKGGARARSWSSSTPTKRAPPAAPTGIYRSIRAPMWRWRWA